MSHDILRIDCPMELPSCLFLTIILENAIN